MKCQTCDRTGDPMYQLACGRAVCNEVHMVDGEAVDCSVHGPVSVHFNVIRCEDCGGGAEVERLMAEHQLACVAR